MSQLFAKVAPEIRRQMGHSVTYIDQTEITSVPPDASGRDSDEPKNSSSHKLALVVLGAALGVVCLGAIVVIVWYRRKKKR